MLSIYPGQRSGREREDHCRRVSVLAGRVAERLSLTAAARKALELASVSHHVWNPLGPPPAGVDDETLRGAARVLDSACGPRERGGSEWDVAGRVLNLCNTFDEAMEFSAFDGDSLADAAEDFEREAQGRNDPRVAAAFAAVTKAAGGVRIPVSLAVMPRAAAELMRMRDDAAPAELARIAALDQVFAGRLIGFANSASLGGEHRTSQPVDAVVRVGVPAARKILISACFGKLFVSRPLQDLWKHSQAVAGAARALAETAGITDPDDAWLAGLLHDAGRLVLEAAAGELRCAEIGWLEAGFPRVYAEMLTFRADHAAIGGEMLRKWGIDERIVMAVERHHRPECDDTSLASTLFLAERCCIDPGRNHMEEALSVDYRLKIAAQNTGIAPERLAEYAAGALDPLAIAG